MASSKKNTTSKAGAEKAKRLAIVDVVEVQQFMDIKQELEALKAEHPDVFMQYNDLVDRYNTALEAAEAVVRAKEITCGPFENFSVSHTYDAAKMLDELGEKTYLACGGKIVQRAYYELDSSMVEAAIASGKIPAVTVDNFRTIKRSYHAPKKIVG